ncbi:26S proteasome regulatory complex, ATPase RPT1 [Pseudoloma neurophilia]|uniref:26S proteasome regulatory subunit 7 homolog n=1 Tax=Pseudoloma neurophilia TaxID=146866 RepID=A0A0R0LVN6_9MICR|nr:26S proteasome regulatory complex, ATPase RPT1 [Pseudoloma neurophilia]
MAGQQDDGNKKAISKEELIDDQLEIEKDAVEILKYGLNYYSEDIKAMEKVTAETFDRINIKLGMKEVETGLAPPSTWDIDGDRQRLESDHTLQVAKVNKVITHEGDGAYMINLRQLAKFIVSRGQYTDPRFIEEGMRVGVDRIKHSIILPLPRKIDASVTMMQVVEKPEVTYDDIGGCYEEIEKIKEVVEAPLLNPEKFINLGIDPPKGVLLYGPPGTGKTLLAKAVANRTNATFIRVIGSELLQKYVGEGARMVREIFEMAKRKKACIIFFDEVDAFGSTRYSESDDNEVQRTMLELINQLDGFESRGNIKVIMATNRPDTLDPALLRPGRLDRKVEFSLPDLKGRTKILQIHTRVMSVEKNIRYELIARLCPNATGAELRSVCTEAGMFAIRERRKAVTENDFLKSVEKVIKGYAKFSATPKYLTYN